MLLRFGRSETMSAANHVPSAHVSTPRRPSKLMPNFELDWYLLWIQMWWSTTDCAERDMSFPSRTFARENSEAELRAEPPGNRPHE